MDDQVDQRVAGLLPAGRTEPDVSIYLPGPPRGKASGRAMLLAPNPDKGRLAPKAMILQDSATRSYQSLIRYAGERAMAGRPIFDCPLRGRVTAVMAVPQSKPQKWKAEALAGIVRPIVKPDDDNILKIRDGLKGVVYRDDCLFVESVVRKFYGERPGLLIEIWRFVGTML